MFFEVFGHTLAAWNIGKWYFGSAFENMYLLYIFKHLAVFLYVHIYIILTLLDIHIYIGHMSICNSCAT